MVIGCCRFWASSSGGGIGQPQNRTVRDQAASSKCLPISRVYMDPHCLKGLLWERNPPSGSGNCSDPCDLAATLLVGKIANGMRVCS